MAQWGTIDSGRHGLNRENTEKPGEPDKQETRHEKKLIKHRPEAKERPDSNKICSAVNMAISNS